MAESSPSPSPCIVIPDEFKGYPLESFCLSNNFRKDLEYVLIPGGFIGDRIERMACDIASKFASQSFTALCILKGGYQFFGDLMDKVRQYYRFSAFCGHSMTPQSNDGDHQRITVEFIRVKSYIDDQSSGKVAIHGIETLDSLRGKNVLIVEDIVDSGRTMVKLLDILKEYDLKSVRVTSLFLKRNSKSSGYRPDYIGFEIPDKFVVGCNLDYNEYFRDLSHVCVMSEKAKHKYSAK